MKLLERGDLPESDSKKVENIKTEDIANLRSLTYQALSFIQRLWFDFIKSQAHIGGWNPKGFRNPRF